VYLFLDAVEPNNQINISFERKDNSENNPIRPMLDVSLLGTNYFLLFVGHTTIKQLLMLRSCLDLFCDWEIEVLQTPGQPSGDSQLLFSQSELTYG